jgi:hypothetical protein
MAALVDLPVLFVPRTLAGLSGPNAPSAQRTGTHQPPLLEAAIQTIGCAFQLAMFAFCSAFLMISPSALCSVIFLTASAPY